MREAYGLHSIIFLCPYFGKINREQHRLWLQSCGANPDIRFLIITDDAEALRMAMPENVRGIFMTWQDCVSLVMGCFDFDVVLSDPYKLCDYRPAFGHIFSAYVEGYDFWGHMDSSDTVLGDLRKFLSEDILSSYDKVHSFGHLTLYRNTEENNMRYLVPSAYGTTARTIFLRPELMGFDDMNLPWSINTVYRENGFSLLERIDNLVADLFPSRWAFEIVEDCGKKVPRIFEWDRGKLYDVTVNGCSLQKREIGYVHFQKRKMDIRIPAGTEHFYMIPNSFIPARASLTSAAVEEWSRDRLYLDPLKGRIKRIMNYAKKPDVFLRKLKQILKLR